MWGLFRRFEKVSKTVVGYSYTRNGKKIKVKKHTRTVTKRKGEDRAQRRTAPQRGVSQRARQSPMKQPKPQPASQEAAKPRWLKYGDIIEFEINGRRHMAQVDETRGESDPRGGIAFLVDYFNESSTWTFFENGNRNYTIMDASPDRKKK